MAGINIVSAYITMAAMQLKTTSVFQACGGILTAADDRDGNEDEFEDGSLR
jgi:hypothetical protein